MEELGPVAVDPMEHEGAAVARSRHVPVIPVRRMYSAYASASSARVTPRQVRTILPPSSMGTQAALGSAADGVSQSGHCGKGDEPDQQARNDQEQEEDRRHASAPRTLGHPVASATAGRSRA